MIKVREKEEGGCELVRNKNINFNQFSMEFHEFLCTEHCKHTTRTIYECPSADMCSNEWARGRKASKQQPIADKFYFKQIILQILHSAK
jgi:hypothetical protein